MKRVVYSSRRDDDTGGTGYSKDFEDIASLARERNASLGVTCFLICTPGWYCQILEGKDPHIDALVRKIGMDKRHYNMKVLVSREIARPYFPQWGMQWKHKSIANRIAFLELGLVATLQPFHDKLDSIARLVSQLSGLQGKLNFFETSELST